VEFNIGDLVKYKETYLKSLGFPISESLFTEIFEVTDINNQKWISGFYTSSGIFTYLGDIDKLELVEKDTSQLSDWI
jgi:hypothetical protein